MFKKQGFTLVELLIVIGVLAILASIVFVALNPLGRFQNSRNARRWADVNAYLDAIKLYQVDHEGVYFDALNNLGNDLYYQIGVGDGCASVCLNPTVILQDDCADMEELVEGGYLPLIMIDPNDSEADTDITKYYLIKSSTGSITVGSCSEELGTNETVPQISATR